MRRSMAMVCAVAFIVMGCADDEPAQTIAPPEPPEPDQTEEIEADPRADAEDGPEAATEPGDLDPQDGLLRLEDMPTGWTEEAVADEDEDEGGGAAGLCGVQPLDEVAAIDRADRRFAAGDLGPLLDQLVAVFEDGEAAEAMGSVLDALDDCDEWTEEAEDGPVTFRPSPLSFPGFGDETVAVRISAEADIVDATVDMIVWRHGDLLSAIAYTEIFGSPDAEQIEEIVTIADERLEDLR